MSTLSDKEFKARARSFVAGLKCLKKDLRIKTVTEFAAFIGQPATTVKGWLKNAVPSEAKMSAVDIYLLDKAARLQAQASAIHCFVQ